MAIKTIYIFGNPLLPFDNSALKLIPKLKETFPQIKFMAFDPNENLKPINKELYIIDVAEGIKKLEVITDLNKIKTEKICSLHDFDLAFNLKLLEKIGKLEKIIIWAIPMDTTNQRKIFIDLANSIKSFIDNKEDIYFG